MKEFEIKLASRLLEMAADLLSLNGCNDLEPSIFGGIEVADRKELELAINAWENPSCEPDQYMTLAHIHDYVLMSYLASRLAEYATESEGS